jgi:hypothetical protein
MQRASMINFKDKVAIVMSGPSIGANCSTYTHEGRNIAAVSPRRALWAATKVVLVE